MKHKHADLIIAWANGAEIQAKDGYGKWETIHQPNWDYDCEYRIKPKPPLDWRQKLIDAAISGKIIEVKFTPNGPWHKSVLMDYAETGTTDKFCFEPESEYRIKPEEKKPVVRWLWSNNNGCLSNSLYTESEIHGAGFPIKLEWSRQEFPT